MSAHSSTSKRTSHEDDGPQMLRDDELRFRHLVQALWGQKWWIMLTVLLVMTVTAAVCLCLPKTYLATAVLVPPEVDQAWPTPDGLKTRFGAASVGTAVRPNTTATDIIVGMLQTRSMAMATIDKFDLRRVYAEQALIKFPPMPWQENGGKWYIEEVIDALQDHSTILITKEGMLSISVEDRDPKRAAAMVQFYLDELARMNMELQTTYQQYLSRIADPPAVPEKKYKPRTAINSLIAGAATGLIWIAVVFCRLNLADDPDPERPR
jgi:uncharacterized protein involved in exopolysaccharide biosynthesis